MVCYSAERKIIFIHVPKTGGMSIERILIENYGFKNFTFKNGPYEFLNMNEGKLGFFKYILKNSEESKIYNLMEFTKFTFVRNPYKRAFSGIRFLSETSILDFPENLHDFYQKSLEIPFFYTHFNLTQCDVLKDNNDEIKMDYIGKFENFNEDLNHILFDIFQFERKDFSKYHIHKTDPTLIDFDDELVKEIVNSLHKEDFERFGYEIENL